ncbi:MAG: hypothetical protein OXE53_18795 [Deltaproteobacteria bacterium]|nr:hypothetical protein [Deltaproteobacteria bacterium]
MVLTVSLSLAVSTAAVAMPAGRGIGVAEACRPRPVKGSDCVKVRTFFTGKNDRCVLSPTLKEEVQAMLLKAGYQGTDDSTPFVVQIIEVAFSLVPAGAPGCAVLLRHELFHFVQHPNGHALPVMLHANEVLFYTPLQAFEHQSRTVVSRLSGKLLNAIREGHRLKDNSQKKLRPQKREKIVPGSREAKLPPQPEY